MKDNKTQLFLSLDDPSSLCDLGGGHTAPDSMDLVIFLGNEMWTKEAQSESILRIALIS